jgi:hypothetical protein
MHLRLFAANPPASLTQPQTAQMLTCNKKQKNNTNKVETRTHFKKRGESEKPYE